jgi:acetyl esterase/lipase
VLLYPVTEMKTLDSESHRRKGIEYLSMRKGIRVSRKLYARDRKDYAEALFSPLLSTKDDDKAPTRALLLLAGRDGLLDDGARYANHLRALGGDVRCVVYDKAALRVDTAPAQMYNHTNFK